MKITFRRLDHVQVCIPPGAEEQAREFYGGVLGLEEIEKPEALRKNGGMWYVVAGLQLHVGVEETAASNSSKRHPAFEVERLAEVKEYLRANDIKLRDEPDIPGVSRFSFFDPFGNRFELLEKTPAAGADEPQADR